MNNTPRVMTDKELEKEIKELKHLNARKYGFDSTKNFDPVLLPSNEPTKLRYMNLHIESDQRQTAYNEMWHSIEIQSSNYILWLSTVVFLVSLLTSLLSQIIFDSITVGAPITLVSNCLLGYAVARLS